MNTETKQLLDEAAAIGRIKSMSDALIVQLSRGIKRSAPERKRLWNQISDEATACADAIPQGTKARASKPRDNGATLSRPTPTGIPERE